MSLLETLLDDAKKLVDADFPAVNDIRPAFGALLKRLEQGLLDETTAPPDPEAPPAAAPIAAVPDAPAPDASDADLAAANARIAQLEAELAAKDTGS